MPVCHKSLKDLELRKNFNVTILLVQRGPDMLYNPGPDMELLPGDTVFMFGTPDKLLGSMNLFSETKSISGT